MRSLYQSLSDYFRKVNWKLLLFLVLVLNVKMRVKIIAVIFSLLLNHKMFLGKNIYRQKFIWFYFSMIVIAVIDLLLNVASLSTNYLVAAGTGIFFWMLCIAVAFINSWFVAKTDIARLHATITFFFILNAAVTIGQLLLIILDSGSVNPYTYQGMHQKYFISAGDAIKGITFDTSTTNAIINTFGIIYSLKRSKFFITLMCMSVMLLTASNFTILLLLAALLFLFVFQSDRNQKSIIIVCSFMLLIFLTKVSPQNGIYITGYFQKKIATTIAPAAPATVKISVLEKPDNLLSADEKKQKIAMLYLDSLYKIQLTNEKKETSEVKISAELLQTKPSIPKPNIHTEPYQKNKDTTLLQKRLLEFAESKIASFDTSLQVIKKRKEPGKILAFLQTINFFKQHPSKIFTGTGIGNFSSKLAFRATGLGVAGGYPAKFVYINDDFKNNHLKLYLEYFSKEMELHSLTQTPNSVYDQLLAEYGLAGIFSFVFFYLGFFIKHLRRLTYSLPFLIILLGALGAEYWFEQLSIIIVFELILFLTIKEMKELSAE